MDLWSIPDKTHEREFNGAGGGEIPWKLSTEAFVSFHWNTMVLLLSHFQKSQIPVPVEMCQAEVQSKEFQLKFVRSKDVVMNTLQTHYPEYQPLNVHLQYYL